MRSDGGLTRLPDQLLHQLLTGDADRLVHLGHGDAVVTGVTQALPPRQDMQIVGVQQGTVDVEEDARSS
ncbi:hypothetical protein GCM10009841_29910 [Microlunatus panaciterrae]